MCTVQYNKVEYCTVQYSTLYSIVQYNYVCRAGMKKESRVYGRLAVAIQYGATPWLHMARIPGLVIQLIFY